MRKSICWVTTSPLIVNFFLVPHLLRLSDDYAVTLVVNTAEGTALKQLPGVEIVSIAIPRNISLPGDTVALLQLTHLFRKRRFDLVHSFGPKAGLIASLAGWISRIQVRLHTFTGQVWVTRKGVMRQVLRAADRLIGILDTAVLADSPSQKGFLEKEGVLAVGTCRILGSGSLSGVNTARFKLNLEAKDSIRREWGIPDDAVLILFLGRLKADKGVPELLQAFRHLVDACPNVFLALVGPDEDDCLGSISSIGAAATKVRSSGYTPVPERYIAASDILCLPSHREGFGSVIIEAAAAGIPSVAARVYGITDAVIDGQTGLLHVPEDAIDLGAKLECLVVDPDYRGRLGENARRRATTEFAEGKLTAEMVQFYRELL